jgi:4'-phosphopantetheinyl transferase
MTRLFACKLVDEETFEQLKTEMLKNVPAHCAQKALSYFHSNDAQRHLIGELLARYALKHISGERPIDPFTTGDKGKPHPEGINGTHFNVSHSGNWVVVATSPLAVGVDVERMRKVPEGVAYRFFSEPEKQLLDKADNEFEKAHIFYTLWTLKESFLKAIGKGLTKSLSTFTVQHAHEGGYELAPDDETKGFYLKAYSFEEGYKLAACSASPVFDETVVVVGMDELLEI